MAQSPFFIQGWGTSLIKKQDCTRTPLAEHEHRSAQNWLNEQNILVSEQNTEQNEAPEQNITPEQNTRCRTKHRTKHRFDAEQNTEQNILIHEGT